MRTRIVKRLGLLIVAGAAFAAPGCAFADGDAWWTFLGDFARSAWVGFFW